MMRDTEKSATNIEIRGVHLWLVLWKVTRVMEEHAHRSIAELNIGLSDFGVLEALLHKGPLPVHELGKKVLLTSGSITSAIDRLEKRGLVERGGDSTDRRKRIVSLLPDGRKFIERAFSDHMLAMEVASLGLPYRERETLVGLLQRLGRQAENQLIATKKQAARKRAAKKEAAKKAKKSVGVTGRRKEER